MATAPATRLRSRPLNPAEQQSVREQLERIFESPSFRSSPRCQQLLRYLVASALDGKHEMLRERVIGAEVFQRTPAYDTGEDSIVRVRANDLRKRLGQYYDGAPDREHEPRIHLPAGSYLPEFVFHPSIAAPGHAGDSSAAEPAVLPPNRLRRSLKRIGIFLAAGCAAALSLQYFRPAHTVVDQFWAPIVRSPKPVLFSLGDAQIFNLSKSFQKSYFRTHPRSTEPNPLALEFAPEDVLHGRDLVSVQGQFVGVGGAQSVQMLSNLLALRGKPSMLRTSSDLSFADLRQYPTVLIGAFSNHWSLRLSRQLRFYFDETNRTRICDRQRPGVSWEVQLDQNGRELVDYAVVSRVVHSETGQVISELPESLSMAARLLENLSATPPIWSKRCGVPLPIGIGKICRSSFDRK